MKRNILFAISAILIVGCNSGMNKSILETMDVSDLKKI